MLAILLLALPLFAQDDIGLARALLKLDKVADADTAIRRLTVGKPNDATLLTLAGELQFRQGLFDAAQKSFETSIGMGQETARTLLGLGRLHESEKRHRTAAALFRRAYALDPNDPDVIKAWAGTLDDRKEEIAALERYLLKATDEDPEKLIDARNRIDYLTAIGDRPTATLTDPPDTARIPLSLIESTARSGYRGFGIAVSLNGGKPVTLLFDTGASGIAIHRKLAVKFGVKPLASSRLRGLGDGGSKTAGIGIADTLRIGGVVFKNVPVTISNKKTAGTDDGLIGSDLFQAFLLTMDGPRRELRLRLRRETASEYDAITPKDEEDFTRVRSFNHLMLVETIAGGKKRGWFLIDSGASNNMISLPLARAAAVYLAPGSQQLTGVSGRVDRSYTARNVELQFAGLRTPNPEMAAIDFQKLNKSVRTEISGLLGFPTLETMVTTIDYRNGLVKFQKRKQ